jgi:hypothetical protein
MISKAIFLPVTCAGALALSAGTASAVTMNLDYDFFVDGGQDDFFDEQLDEGDQAFAETGPISVTFSNIVTSSGAPSANINTDGIFFSSDPSFNEVVSVDMVFSVDTIIDWVDIDFTLASSGAFFQISGANGTSGQIAVDQTDDVLFDMGTLDRFLAGETYTLTHNVTGYEYFQIDEFEVSFAPIPVPLSAALLLGGLGTLVGVRRLKRAAGREQTSPNRADFL